jgi:ADP-heptose:LPS heptosyltransferase
LQCRLLVEPVPVQYRRAPQCFNQALEQIPGIGSGGTLEQQSQIGNFKQTPQMLDPLGVRRVLIYRLGSLGDTIGALPSLHLVAQTFPQATRLMLTNIPVHAKAPAASSILEGSGLVQGYLSYPVGTRSPGDLIRLWWRILQFRPEVLVYLTTSERGEEAVRRDARFFRSCGIRRIVGLPTGDLAANRYDPVSGQWESEASRLLRCLSPLGHVDIDDLRNWDLRLTDAEVSRASVALASVGDNPMIACGPGTKMQAKDWGRERWRELLTKLGGIFPRHALVLIGAMEDAVVSEYAAGGWTGTVVNLCGKLTPRESAAVLRKAELFLGPDSGPMHMAAAYGVPCAVPFASVDRRGRWFPIGKHHQLIYHDVECSNCRLQECIEKKKICINSIGVDEMLQAALNAIRQKQTTGQR